MPIRFPFLNFGRKPRADPGRPVQSPDFLRPSPSPNNGVQLGPPDRRTVFSQWQHLGSLDSKPREYVELLWTLVDAESNRNVALKFTGNDAKVVINILGEALRGGRLESKLARHTFSMLRKLAGKTGQLPDSYLVTRGTNYRVEERIFACGGFADVRRGILNKKPVAVKTIRMAEDTSMSRIQKEFCKESVLWMHTSHPNVLGLIAVDIDPRTGTLSMISELMKNGHIMDYIRVKKANRIRLLEDVTRGLQYLHKCGIVHGDLKGRNILIKNGATPQACISDFGFSTLTPTMSFVVSASADESKGTWTHMAPELLYPEKFGLRTSRVSKQADIYAFGMVVYEVLTGRIPFGVEKRRHQEVILRVMQGKRPNKPEKAAEIGFGGGTWELVQRCWDENRNERPTADKILEHFRRVARTSTVVPPGPTIPVHGAEHTATSEPDSSSGDFSPLFAASPRENTSFVQRVGFVADLMTGGGSPHSVISMPRVQLVRAKPSLFDRLGARVKGRGPAPRLGAPTPLPFRT